MRSRKCCTLRTKKASPAGNVLDRAFMKWVLAGSPSYQ
jgi:hypothetical protein